MALHPMFDNLGALQTAAELTLFNTAHIALTRGLTRAGLALLQAQSLDQVYFIASEARQLWLAMCGVQSQLVADAIVAQTETMTDLRQRYPGYWQDQPLLFELTDWTLAATC